jgi:hypothetical protein
MSRRYIAPPSEETKRAQLSIDFGDREAPVAPIAVAPTAFSQAATAEILPPASHADSDAYPLSSGQREHEYLERRAARYEDRCFRAAVVFGWFAFLTLLAEAGLKVAEAALAKYGAPDLEDARLIPGVVAAIAIISAFVTLYYGLRIRQHRPQLALRLIRGSLSGLAAEAMLYCGIALLVLVFVVIVYVSFADIIYLARYIFEHIVYVLDGWEPSWNST